MARPMFADTVQPKREGLYLGDDGLYRCRPCQEAPEQVCKFHAKQVGHAIDGLVSATTLQRAQTDLRYIVAKKPKSLPAGEEDAA